MIVLSHLVPSWYSIVVKLLTWGIHAVRSCLIVWSPPPADLITITLLTWAQSWPPSSPLGFKPSRYLKQPLLLSCSRLSMFKVFGVVLIFWFSKNCVQYLGSDLRYILLVLWFVVVCWFLTHFCLCNLSVKVLQSRLPTNTLLIKYTD